MLTKRPLMCLSLSFVVGMYILSFCDFLSVLAFSLIAILVCVLLLFKRVKNALMYLLCLVLFLTGSIRYDYVSDITRRKLHPFLNKTVDICAEITEDVKITDKTISFYADVVSVADKSGTHAINEKIRFSKYIENNDDVVNFAELSLGDVVSLRGEISTPKDAMNSGGFSYADYLKTENIFFQSNLKNNDFKITERKTRSILHSWANFRKKCISFFDDTFPKEEGAVLKAFITGDSSSVSDEVEDSFSKSGLSHVLAVSGLHVAVFISLVVALLKLFNVSKRKEMLFSAVAALFFVFFTGASVSALRAGILAIFAFIAKLIYRKSDPLTTLSLAAAMLSAFDPLVVYSASFMLSFSATAGILLFYNTISSFFVKFYKSTESKPRIYKILRNIFDSFAVGISAQIFVIPLLVYLFSGFSVMSVISTMLVTPFLSFLLAGGILFIAISFIHTTLAIPVGGFIYILAKLMLLISEYFGGFSFSKIIFGEITPFLLLMYALVIATIFFAIKKRKAAYITAIVSLAVLSVFGLINKSVNFDTAQVSFINVGQGDCALFKAPGDCDVLIDSGGYTDSESTGEYIIAPYLIKNGVTDIEYVIISHMDKDHIVGLSGVLDKLSVENLIIPYRQIDTKFAKDLIEKAKRKNVKITYFTAGDKLKIDEDIEFCAVSPDSELLKYAKEENDTGIVLRLDYGDSSFLFPGDISSDIEKHLVKNNADKLEADVLKVAHHGSKYSSCSEFLDIVKPKYSFIPVGENNYGHPSADVIKRLKDVGAQVYRADIHNDVTFYFNKDEITGVLYKN